MCFVGSLAAAHDVVKRYLVPMDSKLPGKNTTGKPRDVPEDVREKQDPDFSKRDFEDALEAVTRRLVDPSEPDRGSSRR